VFSLSQKPSFYTTQANENWSNPEEFLSSILDFPIKLSFLLSPECPLLELKLFTPGRRYILPRECNYIIQFIPSIKLFLSTALTERLFYGEREREREREAGCCPRSKSSFSGLMSYLWVLVKIPLSLCLPHVSGQDLLNA